MESHDPAELIERNNEKKQDDNDDDEDDDDEDDDDEDGSASAPCDGAGTVSVEDSEFARVFAELRGKKCEAAPV